MCLTRRGFLGLSAFLPWGPFGRAAAPDSHAEFELDRFFIAGFRFHEGPGMIGRMRAGDRLSLRAEPDNPYDGGAVRMEFAGRHMGYVPRSQNAVVGRLLAQRAPVSCRILALDPTAEPWRAVQVAVAMTSPAN